jgi:hypothetical protein
MQSNNLPTISHTHICEANTNLASRISGNVVNSSTIPNLDTFRAMLSLLYRV